MLINNPVNRTCVCVCTPQLHSTLGVKGREVFDIGGRVISTLMDEPILKQRFDQFLQKREPPKTFCPSEVARSLSGEDKAALGFDHWRDAMAPVRELAWELREHRECEILQKGEVIDPDIRLEDISGPIRIRRLQETAPE